MSLGLSERSLAHWDCLERDSYGILKTFQPPLELEDGTIIFVQHCSKCKVEQVFISHSIIRKGHFMHNHGRYGWHPVSRKHRSCKK